MLEVSHLHAGYGKNEILHDISFSVKPGELVGLLGANGCGKTTLLKTLCGIHPGKGTIKLCGQDLRSLSPRSVARMSRYIPQRSGIGIDLSVLDVVLMGFNPQLGLLEPPNASMRRAAESALERVGLQERSKDNFQSLSEGQKQLCILARTTLLEKGILFLDEPESALDFAGRYKILRIVQNWTKETDSSALVCLHDPQLALNTCERLILLKDGCIMDTICPHETPIPAMEDSLSTVFGNLSVQLCQGHNGQSQYVLLWEDLP